MTKKIIKYSILVIILVLISILGFFVYKNLFAGINNTRYENIENYKLTNDEKNSIKDKVKELEGIKSVDVYIDSKIIKIVVKLEKDIDFEAIKNKANESIECFSKENLSYYDLEFFVDYVEQDNQIGYKFKTDSEFSW